MTDPISPRALALGAFGAFALLTACMEAEMPVASDGKGLYMEYCSACHGTTGIGDGPLARASAKAPQNLTLLSVRHGDTFPRAKVMSTVDGYTRLDTDKPGMPSFGELLEGDLIPYDSGDGKPTPTPRKLVALVEYIESIQAMR